VPLSDQPALLVTGLVAMLVGLVLLYVAFTATDNGVPLAPHYNLTVQFPSLGGLGAHGADVRIAGKLVGQTQDARLIDGVPTVNLQLESSVGRLPVDTTFRIRLRGLLGAEYVEVIPGQSRQTLRNGAVVPERQTSATTQLFDVLDALQKGPRLGLGEMIRGLGDGLAGRGAQLNATLAATPALVANLHTALTPLLAQNGSVSRLISGSESLFAALAPVSAQMAAGTSAGARAIAPFADQATSVQATLEVAPSSLTGVRGSLSQLGPVLASAQRFANATTRFAAHAPAALQSLTALLRGAPPVLPSARAALAAARSAVPPVLTLAHTLGPVLPETDRVLETLRAPAALLGGYGCYLAGFAAGWRSFLGLAPRGQNGPLGPMTMLRVGLAAVPVSVGSFGPAKTPGSYEEPSAPPCSSGAAS
jgi:virulence factor Mce-like protein